jgi:uncharacterized protein YacL (UPF0231 family)
MLVKNKRGQVTTFIIIAIVIVAVALFIIFLRPRITDLFMSEQRATELLASQVEPIRDAVADCVSESSQDFFITTALQGGNYDPGSLPRIYLAGQEYVVVMYKDSNMVRVNKLPMTSSIEQDYINFLEGEGFIKIDECLNNFDSFKRTVDIELGQRKITAEIHDEIIIFNVDWPITIKKQTITKTITQQVTQKQAQFLMPFGNLWQVAADMVECESQVDCDFEGVKIDEYIWDYPQLLKYISFTSSSIDENNIAWILESQPFRENEEKYQFYFGIMREYEG